MKFLLYIAVLLLALAAPAERSDVGSLIPVEVISVYKEEAYVQIRTDTGNVGVGQTPEEAYRNLELGASGDIYLDTADYLVLLGEGIGLTEWLRGNLKGSVRVCLGAGELELPEAAPYLAQHRPETRLRDVGEGTKLQVLRHTPMGFALE